VHLAPVAGIAPRTSTLGGENEDFDGTDSWVPNLS
jgi:hypothetical protein